MRMPLRVSTRPTLTTGTILMLPRPMHFRLALAALLMIAAAADAQDSTRTSTDSTRARRDSVARLNTVKVTAERASAPVAKPLQALTLPVTASVTAARVQQTVNLVDAEDAVKYLPSVFLRKR